MGAYETWEAKVSASFRDKLGETVQEEPEKFAKIRTFHLNRVEDISGVSGKGKVAVGVVMPSGKCIIEWTTTRAGVPGLGIYDDMEGLKAIHGHEGATEVVFDGEEEKDETKD